MTKHLLIGLFSVIFLVMLGTTIYASFDRSVFAVGEQLLADPWFQATLVDAYLGFLTFYVWVAYKEASLLTRGFWLVAIMCLGNMAMSAYVLLQLRHWDSKRGPESLLLRKQART